MQTKKFRKKLPTNRSIEYMLQTPGKIERITDNVFVYIICYLINPIIPSKLSCGTKLDIIELHKLIHLFHRCLWHHLETGIIVWIPKHYTQQQISQLLNNMLSNRLF